MAKLTGKYKSETIFQAPTRKWPFHVSKRAFRINFGHSWARFVSCGVDYFWRQKNKQVFRIGLGHSDFEIDFCSVMRCNAMSRTYPAAPPHCGNCAAELRPVTLRDRGFDNKEPFCSSLHTPTRPTCLFLSPHNACSGPCLTCIKPVYSLRFFRGFLSKRMVLLLCFSLKMVRVPNSILNHFEWVNSSMNYVDLNKLLDPRTTSKRLAFTPNMTLITFTESRTTPLRW